MFTTSQTAIGLIEGSNGLKTISALSAAQLPEKTPNPLCSTLPNARHRRVTSGFRKHQFQGFNSRTQRMCQCLWQEGSRFEVTYEVCELWKLRVDAHSTALTPHYDYMQLQQQVASRPTWAAKSADMWKRSLPLRARKQGSTSSCALSYLYVFDPWFVRLS
jgi:hypothetical protein